LLLYYNISACLLSNEDGKNSSGSLETSKNEAKKEQKIRQKSVPYRIGRSAKSLIQLP